MEIGASFSHWQLNRYETLLCIDRRNAQGFVENRPCGIDRSLQWHINGSPFLPSSFGSPWSVEKERQEFEKSTNMNFLVSIPDTARYSFL